MGSPSFLTSPFFNIGLTIMSMQFAKKFDFEDPEVLNYLRIIYYTAQVLVITFAYGLIYVIKKKNDTTKLEYNEQPKPSFGGGAAPDTPKKVETTNLDYDIAQVKSLIQSTATSIGVISLMHWQFGFNQPLMMQSIMPIKNLLASKVALIHIWNDAPEGNLKRPFASESPFSGLFGGSPAADNHEKKE